MCRVFPPEHSLLMATVDRTMSGSNKRRVRRQGPVTLRDKQIPATTTDQRLLDRRGPSDWVHTDPWRVMRIQAEFVEGFGLLAELGVAVSIFGSARSKRGTAEYQLADEIAGGEFGMPCLLVLRRLEPGRRHDKSELNAILRHHGLDA